MTTLPEVMLAAATALGIGLMVGLERERRKGDGADREPVGLRTCAITALLGHAAQLAGGTLLLAAVVVAITVLASAAYRRNTSQDPGITSEVALVLTTCLGARALAAPAEAAALGVLLTLLLALKDVLHGVAKRWLSQHEVHDGLMLATAALVALPLLPNHAWGPAGALNPYRIGQFTVLLMALSTLGHLATRLAGAHAGRALSGLLGGFVSSTATIASLGALSRQTPTLLAASVSGAMLSTLATLVQITLLLYAGSPALLATVWPALAASALVCLCYAALFLRRGDLPQAESRLREPGRMFDLRLIAGVSLLITSVGLLSAVLLERFGTGGLFVASLLAGLADAHATVISIAMLVQQGGLTRDAAALPLLAAFLSNTLAKCLVARTSGGSAYFWRLAPGLLLVAAVLAIVLRRPLQ